jgi:TnpA family transposase
MNFDRSFAGVQFISDLLIKHYGSLSSLVSRADQTIDTEQIAEQWDRMGQLYASLKTGHVMASVALKRLVGFSAKNRFYLSIRKLFANLGG